jgi:List-Bact-rpt repeat protein
MNAQHNRLDHRLAVLVALAAVLLALPAAAPAAEPQASISVTVVGSGRVQSSPAGLDCGVGTCTAAFPLGSAIQLNAAPTSGFHLSSWSGACVGGSQQCEASADEDTRVQAEFASGSSTPQPATVPLLVSFSGKGRVTSTPQGLIDCGSTCWTSFSGGGHVTLAAAPASDFVFDGWAGDCSGNGTCDVALTSLRNVVAVFKPRSIPNGTSTLTIANSDPGNTQGKGIIHVSWPGLQQDKVCDSDQCDFDGVPNGVRVKIQPVPAANTEFSDYGDACTGKALQCVVILSQDAGVGTGFQNAGALSTAFGLNLTRSGGGAVQSVPPGIDCGANTGCRAAFKPGLTVRLTANPGTGFSFGGWTGDCGGTAACAVSMNVSRTVSAAFRAGRDQLRITKSGRGIGTVTTDPPGIACGSDCTYSFRRGSAVTLRAAPNSKSRFGGWTGACTGKGPCSLTIAAPAEVTAGFDRCAASDFSSFVASATRSPRRVSLRVTLADRATARVRLLRHGATLTTRTFANQTAGAKILRIPVPSRAPTGNAKVELRLKDVCGRTRALTRTVRLR